MIIIICNFALKRIRVKILKEIFIELPSDGNFNIFIEINSVESFVNLFVHARKQ